MYVTVALAGTSSATARRGLSALANYGERVREAVDAMLYRIHAQGRSYDSPYCAWPRTGRISECAASSDAPPCCAPQRNPQGSVASP
jgi:hypothetical protein